MDEVRLNDIYVYWDAADAKNGNYNAFIRSPKIERADNKSVYIVEKQRSSIEKSDLINLSVFVNTRSTERSDGERSPQQ